MTDWSPQEVLRLRELATAGYSQSQIGKVLGRTKSSVSGKMLRLGKRRAPTPPLANGVSLTRPSSSTDTAAARVIPP